MSLLTKQTVIYSDEGEFARPVTKREIQLVVDGIRGMKFTRLTKLDINPSRGQDTKGPTTIRGDAIKSRDIPPASVTNRARR